MTPMAHRDVKLPPVEKDKSMLNMKYNFKNIVE